MLSLSRRQLVVADVPALAALTPSRSWVSPALALEHGAADAARSDPWLATNPYDGSLYLTWISPDPAAADPAASPDASPVADNQHGGTGAITRVYIARSTDSRRE